MKNKAIWAFIPILVCLPFVLSSDVFAQDEDPSIYFEPTVPPDFPKTGDAAIAEETVNGITVKIIDAKLSTEERKLWSDTEKKIYSADNKALTFDVCFSTPDSGEWSLFGGKETVKFGPVAAWQYQGMSNWWDEKLADERMMGEKCTRFIFDLDVEIELPLTLTFEQAVAIPRERFHPCEEILERFASNQRAVAAGLNVSCSETPNGNPPGIGFPFESSVRLDRFDETVLTKQEAHVLMLEIESGVIYGPWVFTFDSIREE